MEVHHHNHVNGKKWTHYVWEFLMLFLAVFCGFLAENVRETYVEHHREKQFVLSVAEDLRRDIYDLDSLTKIRQRRKVGIDSLFLLLNSPDPNVYGKDIYYYARVLTYKFTFVNNDRTIQELKNSGNFRLISKQQVSDTIMYYNQLVQSFELYYAREEVFTENYIEMLSDYFDSRVFNEMTNDSTGFQYRPSGNPRLLNSENPHLQKLLTAIHFFKVINLAIMGRQNRLKSQAESLLQFIQKEYQLK
jgi:hypothetical protein